MRLCRSQRSRRGSWIIALIRVLCSNIQQSETQGSFLFAVEVDAIPPDGTGFEVPCSNMSVVTDPYVFHQNARREINTATLTSVLKTYGGVRSFGLAQRNQQVRVDEKVGSLLSKHDGAINLRK